MLFAVFLGIKFLLSPLSTNGFSWLHSAPHSFGPYSRTRPADIQWPGAITDQTGSQQNCVPVTGDKGVGDTSPSAAFLGPSFSITLIHVWPGCRPSSVRLPPCSDPGFGLALCTRLPSLHSTEPKGLQLLFLGWTKKHLASTTLHLCSTAGPQKYSSCFWLRRYFLFSAFPYSCLGVRMGIG